MLALPAEAVAGSQAGFVPIIAETAPEAGNGGGLAPERLAKPSSGPRIEISLAGAVIRVASGTDCALLAQVLRALRDSAA